MINSSSLSRAALLAIAAGLLALAFAVVEAALGRLSVTAAVFAAAVVACAGFAVYSLKRAARAVASAVAVCRQIDAGNFEARIIGIRERGDLGDLLYGINEMIDRADAFVRESAASLECVSRNQYFRRIVEKGMTGAFLQASRIVNSASAAMEKKVVDFKKVVDHFERSMKDVVNTVASAATELQSSAQSMEATASSTSQRATTVAAAAEEAAVNVQTVASAAEQLSSSISEISRQVAQSSEVARAAVAEAERANERVRGLASSSQKIGEVVELINDIADQTNLLALNATIEAARAGDAGKGFAVVASEVKNLANQTGKATDDIREQIAGVQGSTKDAVQAIKDIGVTIARLNEIASAIAAAVEQQSSATQEIARNVEQASAGTTEVTGNISAVTAAAGETGEAANQVLGAAAELSKQGQLLDREMQSFLVEIRKVV